jgi:uncharacterized protein (DUF2062 family)
MMPSIKKKLLKLVKMLLGEGMSVEKVTLSIALGFALGIFPLVGSTTVLCAIAALVLRLNLPAIQAVNYLVYPLQLVLLVPFYGAGNWLFGNRSLPAIKQNLIDLVKTDFWGGLAGLWDLTMYAAIVWLMISPLVVVIIYSLMKPVIRSIAVSDRLPHSLKNIWTG